ncbi:K(+)-transporting ATPase subunit C [Qiania dongpingensis]|uniref:Potassium-transporting ATPase KdpC subunit n=1 Tax=Qiania dongpingensis TaxID=2763669 RepID=A0A7G9G0Z0_9FIRM|nr:K(+)-transporting ATPase subunit C [Qiania dongpingensis]QNM04472.1 K(+)-transporting ATPase subunit C [Qiania dongpingensis]
MKAIKTILPRAALLFLLFTVICGILYPGAVTAVAQTVFPDKANGSIIEVNGKKYGSALLGQQYTDVTHMWGRIMNLNTNTYKDKDGNAVMYASPSNLSPVSEEYKELLAQRVEKIRSAHPEKGDTPIPVDLVTCSGSGLDPDISAAAAEYQAERLARENGRSVEEIEDIIEKCTTHKIFGIFGEETVNVLKVNLMLDGILE